MEDTVHRCRLPKVSYVYSSVTTVLFGVIAGYQFHGKTPFIGSAFLLGAMLIAVILRPRWDTK